MVDDLVARNLHFSITELQNVLNAIEFNDVAHDQEFDRQLKEVEAAVIVTRKILSKRRKVQ